MARHSTRVACSADRQFWRGRGTLCSFWKKPLPEDVQDMGGVARGFTRGLQLINTAMRLGI